MARKRDYYEVLGVGREADDGEIKRAFRAIAQDITPDQNPDDPQAKSDSRRPTRPTRC